MNVLLNNQVTLKAMGYTGFLIIGIDGLGISDIRTSSFVFSGRDGGLNTDQFADMRNINITAKLVSPTTTQHAIDRKALITALPIGSTFPVYFTMFDGTTYRIDCSLIKLSMPINNGGKRSDLLIQLSAGDPLFYRTDGGDSHTANISRVAQGGYVTPYTLPVVWDSGSAPTAITNAGDVITYPVITLNNAAINPSVTNQATNETFKLMLTTVDGDVLVIDMGARTVTLNGATVIGNKTASSIWWGLQPGANGIVLNSDSAGDDVTGTLTWRNGVRGI
jgi:hypothetical protein